MSRPQERIDFQKDDLTPQPLCRHQPIPRCKAKEGEGKGQYQEARGRTPAAQAPPRATHITWSPAHTCQSGPPMYMTYSLPMSYTSYSTAFRDAEAAADVEHCAAGFLHCFCPAKWILLPFYRQVKRGPKAMQLQSISWLKVAFFPTHHT